MTAINLPPAPDIPPYWLPLLDAASILRNRGFQAHAERVEEAIAALSAITADRQERDGAAGAVGDEARRAATRAEVLSDVDPVALEVWKLQGYKVGAMLAEAQAAVIEAHEVLREITDDYADRFDLDSPSTNPGIKSVIRQARAVLRGAASVQGTPNDDGYCRDCEDVRHCGTIKKCLYGKRDSVGVSKPLQGLAEWLRAHARHSYIWPDDRAALIAWAEKVDAASVQGTPAPAKWRIDRSTGRPILVYENCSVIEGEQAQYVLNLIQRAASVAPTQGGDDGR